MTIRSARDPDDEDVDRRVRRAIADNEVVVFLNDAGERPRCRFSRRALALVRRHREDVTQVDVGANPPAFRRSLWERTGWVTVPQVFVDGEFVGDDDVLADRAERGELAAHLGAE